MRELVRNNIEKSGFGASKIRPGPFKIEPRAAREAKKTPTSDEKRSKKRRRSPGSAQEQKTGPTWFQQA